MKKNLVLACALVVLGAVGAVAYLRLTRPVPASAAPPAAGLCAPHGMPSGTCPWCDPALVDKQGQCAEHGVPEALCSRCNPRLIPGFKAKGDWCAEHAVPESQCKACGGGGAGTGEKK